MLRQFFNEPGRPSIRGASASIAAAEALRAVTRGEVSLPQAAGERNLWSSDIPPIPPDGAADAAYAAAILNSITKADTV